MRAVSARAFVFTPCSPHSQRDRIVRRLNLLRVLDPSLLPDLIHRLHNNNTLLPSHSLTFQFPLEKNIEVSTFPHPQMNSRTPFLPNQPKSGIKKGGEKGPLTSLTHLAHSSASQNMPCPGISHSTSLTSSFLPFLTTCGSVSSALGMNL